MSSTREALLPVVRIEASGTQTWPREECPPRPHERLDDSADFMESRQGRNDVFRHNPPAMAKTKRTSGKAAAAGPRTVIGRAAPASLKAVEEFVVRVREGSADWPVEQPRWFRGEPLETATPLLPSLYRFSRGSDRENQLLQTFRARASAFSSDPLPDRKQTDKWLFLAQHVAGGAPKGIDPNTIREFPLPWFNPKRGAKNLVNENMRAAWEADWPGVDLPMAIHPTYVHPRLRAQRGCFTVQGKQKLSLNGLVPKSILKRYVFDPARKAELIEELAVLGITESVAFPDLDGLARDLRRQFLR
jgi:hypothetical protein